VTTLQHPFNVVLVAAHARCCLCARDFAHGEKMVTVTEANVELWSAHLGALLSVHAVMHESHLRAKPADHRVPILLRNQQVGLDGSALRMRGVHAERRGPTTMSQTVAFVGHPSSDHVDMLSLHLKRSHDLLVTQDEALYRAAKRQKESDERIVMLSSGLVHRLLDESKVDQMAKQQIMSFLGVPSASDFEGLLFSVLAERNHRYQLGAGDADAPQVLPDAGNSLGAVLLYVHNGMAIRDIAYHIHTPKSTVKRHLSSLLVDVAAVARRLVKYPDSLTEFKKLFPSSFLAAHPDVLAIADTTYAYVNKSFSKLTQALAYDIGQNQSGSKRHFYKVLVVASASGFIMDLVGPYFCGVDAPESSIVDDFLKSPKWLDYSSTLRPDGGWKLMYDRGARSREEAMAAVERQKELNSALAESAGGGVPVPVADNVEATAAGGGGMLVAALEGSNDTMSRLVMPAFLNKRSQLPQEEANASRRVTHFRNVIERVIRRLRESKRFKKVMSIAEQGRLLDILYVAAMLSNQYKAPLAK